MRPLSQRCCQSASAGDNGRVNRTDGAGQARRGRPGRICWPCAATTPRWCSTCCATAGRGGHQPAGTRRAHRAHPAGRQQDHRPAAGGGPGGGGGPPRLHRRQAAHRAAAGARRRARGRAAPGPRRAAAVLVRPRRARWSPSGAPRWTWGPGRRRSLDGGGAARSEALRGGRRGARRPVLGVGVAAARAARPRAGVLHRVTGLPEWDGSRCGTRWRRRLGAAGRAWTRTPTPPRSGLAAVARARPRRPSPICTSVPGSARARARRGRAPGAADRGGGVRPPGHPAGRAAVRLRQPRLHRGAVPGRRGPRGRATRRRGCWARAPRTWSGCSTSTGCCSAGGPSRPHRSAFVRGVAAVLDAPRAARAARAPYRCASPPAEPGVAEGAAQLLLAPRVRAAGRLSGAIGAASAESRGIPSRVVRACTPRLGVVPLGQAHVFMRLCTPSPAPSASPRPPPSSPRPPRRWPARVAPVPTARTSPSPPGSTGGPDSYRAGGGYGIWYLDLTNTTRPPARDPPGRRPRRHRAHPEAVPAPPGVLRDGRPHPVHFEPTDEDELVGACHRRAHRRPTAGEADGRADGRRRIPRFHRRAPAGPSPSRCGSPSPRTPRPTPSPPTRRSSSGTVTTATGSGSRTTTASPSTPATRRPGTAA